MGIRSILVSTTYLYLSSASLIQNIVVLLLYRRKSVYIIRKQALFGVSTICGDTVLSVFSILHEMIRLLPKDFKGTTQGIVYTVITTPQLLGMVASQWSQLCYVIDKLITIKYPLHYREHLPPSRRTGLCVAVWILAFGAYIALMASLLYYQLTDPLFIWLLDSMNATLLGTLGFAYVSLILPGPLSLGLFLYIQVLVCKARDKSQQLQGCQQATRGHRLRQNRHNLLLSAGFSVITSMGYPTSFVLIFVAAAKYDSDSPEVVSAILDAMEYVGIFTLITVCATPWIFILRRRRIIRDTFKHSRKASQSSTTVNSMFV